MEGVRGTSYLGDIAFDDVKLVPGQCYGKIMFVFGYILFVLQKIAYI